MIKLLWSVDRILFRIIISNQEFLICLFLLKTLICQGHALQAHYSDLCSLSCLEYV